MPTLTALVEGTGKKKKKNVDGLKAASAEGKCLTDRIIVVPFTPSEAVI